MRNILDVFIESVGTGKIVVQDNNAIHKGKCKANTCTGTEALYRPYGP